PVSHGTFAYIRAAAHGRRCVQLLQDFTRLMRFPFRFHRLQALCLGIATLLGASTVLAQTRPTLDVPYIKTPDVVVERMLELGNVGPNDYLIDLGSGDGRIPVTAAMKYKTRGLGVDIDPERTIDARE